LRDRGDDSEFEKAQRKARDLGRVEAAVQGSNTAFEELYREHVGRVYGLCLRMTSDHALAEDLTQETFVQAWRNLPRFEARSSFGTWLHRIAVNAVLGQARRRSELLGDTGTIEQQLGDVLADEAAGEPGSTRDLEAAIAALPPGARYVLVLAGVYGYSHEETSAMLGVAVGTCKAQLHRARKLLRQRLGEQQEQP
jgi:RNA polymerase sigma-70 factor (ECF subfamily)